MTEIFERLWNRFIVYECAIADTEQERALGDKVAALHEQLCATLNEEQGEAVKRYVDVVCEMEALFAKKAFLKGCELAASFLTETGRYEP